MNRCFDAPARQCAWRSGRVLILLLACLPVAWLIAWSITGISRAAPRTPPATPHAERIDTQRLRSAARAGDLSSTRLLVATLLARYDAFGDEAALGDAFDRLAESWAGNEAFGPEAAQDYVARYCDRDVLALHPFCGEAE